MRTPKYRRAPRDLIASQAKKTGVFNVVEFIADVNSHATPQLRRNFVVSAQHPESTINYGFKYLIKTFALGLDARYTCKGPRHLRRAGGHSLGRETGLSSGKILMVPPTMNGMSMGACLIAGTRRSETKRSAPCDAARLPCRTSNALHQTGLERPEECRGSRAIHLLQLTGSARRIRARVCSIP